MPSLDPYAELFRAQLRCDDLDIAERDVIARAASDLLDIAAWRERAEVDVARWRWVCSLECGTEPADVHA